MASLRVKNLLDWGLCISERGFDDETILRKLSWRRYKIRNDMGKDLMNPLDQWDQEYPRTPEIAFISSGRPVFDQRKLQFDMEYLRSNPPITHDDSQIVKISPLFHKELQIFSEPAIDEHYSIGVDVSEGLETGDASDIRILDSGYNEVARWHGLVDPDLLGDICSDLGYSYNSAMIAVESNNMGIATIIRLKNLQYHNLFVREVAKDKQAEKSTDRIGWNTNKATKRVMIADMIRFYRDNVVKIKDIDLIREMTTVVREADGNVSINSKDRVAAMCVAIQCCLRLPRQDIETHYTTQDGFNPTKHRTKEEYLEFLDSKQDNESHFD